MNFPNWAPSFLVHEYALIEGGNPLDLTYSQELAVYIKPILFRLLTDTDMQPVWERLKSLSNKNQEDSAVHRLWVTVRRAIMHFNYQIDKAQTAAEKKKSLTFIAKKVTELKQAMLDNSYASTIAHKLIHSQMAKANCEFRFQSGDKPKPSDYRYENVFFECDQGEWRDHIFNEEMEAYTGDPDKSPYIIINPEIEAYAPNPAAIPRAIQWRNRSLLTRLAHHIKFQEQPLNFLQEMAQYISFIAHYELSAHHQFHANKKAQRICWAFSDHLIEVCSR